MGDESNRHAHKLMTRRRMARGGFSEKTRELHDMNKRGPKEVEGIRALWEHEQNIALEEPVVRSGFPV